METDLDDIIVFSASFEEHFRDLGDMMFPVEGSQSQAETNEVPFVRD